MSPVLAKVKAYHCSAVPALARVFKIIVVGLSESLPVPLLSNAAISCSIDWLALEGEAVRELLLLDDPSEAGKW